MDGSAHAAARRCTLPQTPCRRASGLESVPEAVGTDGAMSAASTSAAAAAARTGLRRQASARTASDLLQRLNRVSPGGTGHASEPLAAGGSARQLPPERSDGSGLLAPGDGSTRRNSTPLDLGG
jgi:hypothetical protein